MAGDDRTAPQAVERGARTYEEILNDPWVSPEEKQEIAVEAAVGHIAVLLVQRGRREIASLLLEVEFLTCEYDGDAQTRDLWLEVPSDQYSSFTSEIIEEIRAIFREVCRRRNYPFDWLGVREVLPDVGPQWRQQIRDQLGGKRPTNQGRRVRTGPPQFVDDYLVFTNSGERSVYRALKSIQESDLPKNDTIGIYPLAGGRIPGRTWEPDFLVTYKGRAGVLELDGPYHNARRALDVTRDHLLRDAGIGFVDRIPVEALEDHSELFSALKRFLRRLSEVK